MLLGGRARRVEGGWQFTGRWPFSSGTDWCEWIVVGGFAEAADGSKPGESTEPHHFILPRSDYVIHHDSWDVMGLRGTGSKDVEAVEDVLVKVVPEEFGLHAHHWLILHGRYTCLARKPMCQNCRIADLCAFDEKTVI